MIKVQNMQALIDNNYTIHRTDPTGQSDPAQEELLKSMVQLNLKITSVKDGSNAQQTGDANL